jgi:hypothetical protein
LYRIRRLGICIQNTDEKNYGRGAHIFQKSRCHLKTPGAGNATKSNSCNENPKTLRLTLLYKALLIVCNTF